MIGRTFATNMRKIIAKTAGIAVASDCPLCVAKGGVYDCRLVCCRARLVGGMPTSSARRSMIDWMVNRWGERDELEARVKAAFVPRSNRTVKL